ncbi:MAG: hypothetical protein NT027_07630 [Proteobacteria bacterium]|nr:hypothetical protein [Pseudomonadota bacterium]
MTWKLPIFFFVTFQIVSCSESAFESGAAAQKKKKEENAKSNKPQDQSNDGTSSDMNTDSGSTISLQEKREKCWFAVSGGWLGADTTDIQPKDAYSNWGSVFPKTKSGKPIGHGEAFDEVGGVFLEARAEPYTAQATPLVGMARSSKNPEPGKEIEQAIIWTFDSIAIAPGMHAVVKSGTGNILYQGDGPFIGVSGEHGRFSSEYYQRLKVSNSLTDWMSTYVKNVQRIQIISSLHDARSVQVVAIKGGICE